MRRKKNGTREPVTCPEAIKIYNEKMGGVDRGDQLRGYYQVRMKCRKVYKYIYNFLFDVSTNAFIIHKLGHPNSKVNIKDFRVQLAGELIGNYCSKFTSVNGRQKNYPWHISHIGIHRENVDDAHSAERKTEEQTLYGCAKNVTYGYAIRALPKTVF